MIGKLWSCLTAADGGNSSNNSGPKSLLTEVVPILHKLMVHAPLEVLSRNSRTLCENLYRRLQADLRMLTGASVLPPTAVSLTDPGNLNTLQVTWACT